MSQPISVSVQMDAASFHDFAAFDLLRHRKAWHRPLAFTAIFAGVCRLLPVAGGPERRRSPAHGGAGRGGAGRSGRLFLDVLPLPEPPNQKDGPAPPLLPGCCWTTTDCRSGWPASRTSLRQAASMRGTICIWPTAPPNAIYLYVQQNQAYLLNDSLDAAWSLLQAFLPAERLHDMR